ncbi:hypothetical protein AAFF_G00169960 [Aldrovandia affinis]|uniref:Uncharacterized protein n=1 Tax=Aldrovandia affinis TaxID=143900 RepID=A0AAD7RPC8_9TELE|nr:hypothetical protein AAFF_G00169960 [Aldrovandia affinis]
MSERKCPRYSAPRSCRRPGERNRERPCAVQFSGQARILPVWLAGRCERARFVSGDHRMWPVNGSHRGEGERSGTAMEEQTGQWCEGRHTLGPKLAAQLGTSQVLTNVGQVKAEIDLWMEIPTYSPHA